MLTGNTNEPKGFAICNEFNSANYLFIVNGSGLKVQLPYNHWIYCVMNVYTDHKDVFVNGVLAGTDTMSKPIIRSDENLCIGNLGSGHYYVGAIAEVAINNKIMSPEEIQETFRQIITGLKK